METEAGRSYYGMTQKRPVATVKEKSDEDGGLGACPWKNLVGPRPLERRKTPFRIRENVAVIIDLCDLREN